MKKKLMSLTLAISIVFSSFLSPVSQAQDLVPTWSPIGGATVTDITGGIQFNGSNSGVVSGVQLNEKVDIARALDFVVDYTGLTSANTNVIVSITNKSGYLFSSSNPSTLQGFSFLMKKGSGTIWADKFTMNGNANTNASGNFLISTQSGSIANMGIRKENGFYYYYINGGTRLDNTAGWTSPWADPIDTLYGTDISAMFPDGAAYISITRYDEAASKDNGAVNITGLNGLYDPNAVTFTAIGGATKTSIAGGMQFNGTNASVQSGIQINEKVDIANSFDFNIDYSGLTSAGTNVIVSVTNKPGYLWGSSNPSDLKGFAFLMKKGSGAIWADKLTINGSTSANVSGNILLSDQSGTNVDMGIRKESGQYWFYINGGKRLDNTAGWASPWADPIDTMYGTDVSAMFTDGAAYITIIRYDEAVSKDNGAVKITGIKGIYDPSYIPYDYSAIGNAAKKGIVNGVQFKGSDSSVVSGVQLNDKVDIANAFNMAIDYSGLIKASTNFVVSITSKPGYLFSSSNPSDLKGFAFIVNKTNPGQVWAQAKFTMAGNTSANVGGSLLLSTVAGSALDLGIRKENGKYWFYINGGTRLDATAGWAASFADSIDSLYGIDASAMFPDGTAYVSITRYDEAMIKDNGLVKITGVKGKVVTAPVDTTLSPSNILNDNVNVTRVQMVQNGAQMQEVGNDYAIVGVSGDGRRMHPGNVWQSARVLLIPKDGLLSIGSSSVAYVINQISGTSDGVRLMFLKYTGDTNTYTTLAPKVIKVGGIPVSPSTNGYYNVRNADEALNFSFTNLPVKLNDVIYFIIDKNNNSGIDESIIEVKDITLKDANGTNEEALNGVTQAFNPVQSVDGWEYEAVKVSPLVYEAPPPSPAGVISDESLLMQTVDMVPSSGMMVVNDDQLAIVGNGGAAHMHPGTAYSSARVLVIPETGYLTIPTNNAYFNYSNQGTTGDGYRVMFMKKSGETITVLKPSVVYTNGLAVPIDTDGFYRPERDAGLVIFSMANLPVLQGDKIYFILDKNNNNANDDTICILPTITLLKSNGAAVPMKSSLAGYSTTQGQDNWRYEGVIITKGKVKNITTLLANLTTKVSIPGFKSNVVSDGAVVVKNNGTPVTEGFMGTGMTVDVDGQTYIVSAKNDITGDGETTIVDLVKIKTSLLKLMSLTAQETSAISDNDTIGISNLLKVKKMLLYGTNRVDNTVYSVNGLWSWYGDGSSTSSFKSYVDTMKTKGFTAVTYDISWKDVETTQGTFDFTQYDAKLDYAISSGLKVFLRVNTRQQPTWIPTTWLMKDINGNIITTNNVGTTEQISPISYANIEAVNAIKKYWEKTVNHFEARYKLSGNDGAIASYMTMFTSTAEFEYSIDTTSDYSDAAQVAFRDYCNTLYSGNISALNTKWGTSYANFLSINPYVSITSTNKAMLADFMMYRLFVQKRMSDALALAVHSSPDAKYGVVFGSIWSDSRTRNSLFADYYMQNADWLSVADGYYSPFTLDNYKFSVDYSRGIAGGKKFTNEVDSTLATDASDALANGLMNATLDRGGDSIFIANWSNDTMTNSTWTVLSNMTLKAASSAGTASANVAIYTSTATLIQQTGSSSLQYSTTEALWKTVSSNGSILVDIVRDGNILNMTATNLVQKYPTIYMDVNPYISDAARAQLVAYKNAGGNLVLQTGGATNNGAKDLYGNNATALS